MAEDRAADRWAHRSEQMRCRTCIYFVPKMKRVILVGGRDLNKEPVEVRAGDQLETADVQSELGRCRRHAPTLGGWPAVFNVDWCGDHKLDETKL